jgi:hypothetical protein
MTQHDDKSLDTATWPRCQSGKLFLWLIKNCQRTLKTCTYSSWHLDKSGSGMCRKDNWHQEFPHLFKLCVQARLPLRDLGRERLISWSARANIVFIITGVPTCYKSSGSVRMISLSRVAWHTWQNQHYDKSRLETATWPRCQSGKLFVWLIKDCQRTLKTCTYSSWHVDKSSSWMCRKDNWH